MLVENNSNIVKSSHVLTLKNGESVESLELINGQFLVLAQNGLSLYKTMASIEDPLANGLLFAEELPADNYLVPSEGRFMEAAQSGVVGLFDDKVILITPNDIQLFPSRHCALRNQDEIVRLKLG
jgi:hypothetical protein